MVTFENMIRKFVENTGHNVHAFFIPEYRGSNLIPRGITIFAERGEEFQLGVTIINPIGY